MIGRKNRLWQFLPIFFLLTALPLALGQVSVSVEPANPIHEAGLYSNETADFKILVLNLSSARVVGEHLQVLVSNGLVLLDKNVETDSVSFVIPELLPNEQKQLFFVLKAKSKLSLEETVSVNFGETVYSSLVARHIAILASPLAVSLQLDKTWLPLGETGKVSAAFENVSGQSLRGIRSELLVTNREDSLAEPFRALELAFGEKKSASFEFWPKPLTTGKHVLGLQTSFVDENGFHSLDHRIEVNVSDSGQPFLLLIIVIAIIVIVFVAWKKTVSKPPILVSKVALPQKEEALDELEEGEEEEA